MMEKVELYIGKDFWKDWEADDDRFRIFVPVPRYDGRLKNFNGQMALEFERKEGTNEFYLWSFAFHAE